MKFKKEKKETIGKIFVGDVEVGEITEINFDCEINFDYINYISLLYPFYHDQLENIYYLEDAFE